MLSVKSKAAIFTSLCLGLLLSTVFFRRYLLGYNGLDDKVIFFTLAGSVVTIILLLRLFKRPIYLNVLDISLFAFMIYLVLNAQSKHIIQNNYLLATVIAALFYLVARQLLYMNNFVTKITDYFAFLYLFISLAEVGICLYQLYQIIVAGDENVLLIGTFNNTNILAIYVGVSFVYFLHWYILLYKRPAANSLFLRLIEALLLCDIILLPSTQSRTGLLAVLFTGGFLLMVNNKWIDDLKPVHKTRLVIVAIIVGILVSITAYSYKKDSADGRIVIWKAAVLMIKDHPLTGFGFNQFQYKFPDYQAQYFQAHKADGEQFADKDDYAFNDFIQITAEEGVIGGLLFVLLIISLVSAYTKQRSKSLSLRVCMTGIIFILITAFFSYPLEVMPIWGLFVIFLLIISAGLTDLRQIKVSGPGVYALISLGIAVCSWAVVYEYRALKTKDLISNARESFLDENYQAANNYYRQAYALMPAEKPILLEMGKSYLLSNENVKCISLLTTAEKSVSDPFLYSNLGEAYSNIGYYNESERCFIRAIALMPNRMYPRYLLTKLYVKSHQTAKAKALANQINLMPVKIESSATTQMRTEINELIKKL